MKTRLIQIWTIGSALVMAVLYGLLRRKAAEADRLAHEITKTKTAGEIVRAKEAAESARREADEAYNDYDRLRSGLNGVYPKPGGKSESGDSA